MNSNSDLNRRLRHKRNTRAERALVLVLGGFLLAAISLVGSRSQLASAGVWSQTVGSPPENQTDPANQTSGVTDQTKKSADHINYRVDVGVGRAGRTLSIGIGEAF